MKTGEGKKEPVRVSSGGRESVTSMSSKGYASIQIIIQHKILRKHTAHVSLTCLPTRVCVPRELLKALHMHDSAIMRRMRTFISVFSVYFSVFVYTFGRALF